MAFSFFKPTTPSVKSLASLYLLIGKTLAAAAQEETTSTTSLPSTSGSPAPGIPPWGKDLLIIASVIAFIALACYCAKPSPEPIQPRGFNASSYNDASDGRYQQS